LAGCLRLSDEEATDTSSEGTSTGTATTTATTRKRTQTETGREEETTARDEETTTDDEGRWQRAYGGSGQDSLTWVVQANDGGYLAAGWTKSGGNSGVNGWLLRTTRAGDVQWERTYGSGDATYLYWVGEVGDGDYLAVGETGPTNPDASDGLALRVGGDGTLRWQQTYSGCHALWDAAPGPEDGYVVVGQTSETTNDSTSGYLMKIDDAGAFQGENKYGADQRDVLHAISKVANDRYLLAGSTESADTGGRAGWVLWTNSLGEVGWERTLGTGGGDTLWDVSLTDAGDGYVVAGGRDYGGSSGGGWLVQLDTQGGIEWEETYGGVYDVLYRVVRTPGDGYLAVGKTGDEESGDARLVEIDQSGNRLNDAVYEGGILYCGTITGSGYYVASGSTSILQDEEGDGWLVKRPRFQSDGG
jgi:hypothetical protein